MPRLPFDLDVRRQITTWAYSREGLTDPEPYWASALGPLPGPRPPHWCGAFALAALHQAGVGLSVRWVIGLGFLYQLHLERNPLPGDVAYFEDHQHHALVGDTDVDGGMVELINGNSIPHGEDGRTAVRVSRRLTHGYGAPSAYYSIESLIDLSRKMEYEGV